MGRFGRLTNGLFRQADESGSTTIYDENILVVSGAPSGDNEVTGPVITGTAITLPDGKSYTALELEVYLNGQVLESVIDYNYVGGGPTHTQVSFTFQLEIGDLISFRIARGP